MTDFCKFEDVKPVMTGVIRQDAKSFRYNLYLPHFLAEWDVWDYWERRRLESMETLLKKGDVLYDIGAESGWMTSIFAQFVGGENMVIVEPSPYFWPNIRWTWEANGHPPPLATFQCLVGAHPKPSFDWQEREEGWPWAAWGSELSIRNPYRYLHDAKHLSETDVLPLDEICAQTKPPRGITIDVEGAEAFVIVSGMYMIEAHRPIIWCSVHSDLMRRDYKTEPEDLFKIMRGMNYSVNHIASDHEEHYVFLP